LPVRCAAVVGAGGRIEYLDYLPDRLGRWTRENDVWTVAAARISTVGHESSSCVVVVAFGYELVGLSTEERASRRAQAITRGRAVVEATAEEWRDRLSAVSRATTIAVGLDGRLIPPPRGDWGASVGVRRDRAP
jgi:hypothetical protein